MLPKIIFFQFLFALFSVSTSHLLAQEKQSYPENREDNIAIFKPTAGIGIGFLSYFGDIGSASYRNPMNSSTGYQIFASTRLNPFLDFNFHALFGRFEANERSLSRNLNFRSEIRSGGFSLSYNFHHIIPKRRKIEPFVSLGIESLEFLSKTDFYDGQGNKYNYWSDGSIRDREEDHPDAANAVLLQRDYIFETDIRTSNIDGFGKYPERTYAIPLGMGVRMYLSQNIDFKIGTVLHNTFSDYIDGVTKNSTGTRIGNSKKDNFLFSSFSISYRFTLTKKIRKKNNNRHYADVDFKALETEDEDGDGINDFIDKCPKTPKEAKVDLHGCPVDVDQDGVPDYLDKDSSTPLLAFVDKDGVQITDEMFLERYLIYMDTIGKYAKISRTKYEAEIEDSKNKKFVVQLGAYSKGIPPNIINQYLSLPDVKSIAANDSVTLYVAGNYSNYNAALKRKEDLTKAGFNEVVIVSIQNGKYIGENDPEFSKTSSQKYITREKTINSLPADDSASAKPEKNSLTIKQDTINNKTSIPDLAEKNADKPPLDLITGSKEETKDKVVFRIQLGAYNRKLSKNIFSGIEDLIVITGEDGLVRYLTGSYSNYNDAAKQKINILLKGYNGAFITAYKDGKRVNLSSVGATRTLPEDLDEPNQAVSAFNKDLIKFKVQIGAFKNDVPVDIMTKFNNVKGLTTEKTMTGLTRFIAGSFNDISKAISLKNDMINIYGIPDAFIVAYFKDQMIPVQEALELLK